jgi:uncharacterized membrane protein
VSKHEVDFISGTRSGRGAGRAPAGPTQDFVATAATFGVIAAGVALFEVALIPGLVIGGAAVLAPRYLPRLGKRLRPSPNAVARPPVERAATAPAVDRPTVEASLVLPAGLQIGQALAKTITFRVVVTILDFSSNYLVIGELGTAAGLSGFQLVAGPIFYFVHETSWNHFGRSAGGEAGPSGIAVEVPVRLPLRGKAKRRTSFTISRPLAKTITYRTFATAMEFTATYVVVGDLVTAAVLSSFGFVFGPFVYFGHEKAWDYFASRRKRASADAAGPAPAPPLLAASPRLLSP